MNNNIKILLIILGVVVIGGFVALVFQKLNLTEKSIIDEQILGKTEEIDYAKEKCHQKVLDNEYNHEYFCYKDLAKDFKNELLCEIASPPYGYSYVKWYCYADVAKEKNDEKICEKIEAESYKSSCYIAMAEKKNDEKICEYVSESDKYMCYIAMAEKKNDEKICEYILEDDKGKDTCYRSMALNKGDEKLCGKIKDNKNRDLCYIIFATNKNDKDICDLFLSGESKDDCYKEVSAKIKNVSLCDGIVSSEKRNECFNDLSLMLNDKSICDKVKDLSANCKRYFSIDTSSWSVYKNKELGLEFKVPPLFEKNGCTIREISNQESIFNEKECFYLSLDTMSIDPLWGEDRSGEFIRFFVCPLSYCEGLEGFCEAIRKGDNEFGEEVSFIRYITENNKYFAYFLGGTSHGDFYQGMGWEREEISNLRELMFFSIKFIDDLSKEDYKKWLEKETNPKCDYDDDFAPQGYGYFLNPGYKYTLSLP
jgi:hypothetical protein